MKQLQLEDYATLKELSEWLGIDYKTLYNKARSKTWTKYVESIDLLVALPTRSSNKSRKQLVAHYLVGDVVRFLD